MGATWAARAAHGGCDADSCPGRCRPFHTASDIRLGVADARDRPVVRGACAEPRRNRCLRQGELRGPPEPRRLRRRRAFGAGRGRRLARGAVRDARGAGPPLRLDRPRPLDAHAPDRGQRLAMAPRERPDGRPPAAGGGRAARARLQRGLRLAAGVRHGRARGRRFQDLRPQGLLERLARRTAAHDVRGPHRPGDGTDGPALRGSSQRERRPHRGDLADAGDARDRLARRRARRRVRGRSRRRRPASGGKMASALPHHRLGGVPPHLRRLRRRRGGRA